MLLPTSHMTSLLQPSIWATLGFHSLSLEHETSTGVLANFSRELANLKREFANFKPKLAASKRNLAVFMPSIPGFDQLYPGNRRNSFTILRLTAEHIRNYNWRVVNGNLMDISAPKKYLPPPPPPRNSPIRCRHPPGPSAPPSLSHWFFFF